MVHILEELCIFLFLKAQFITGPGFAGIAVSYDTRRGKWSCRCCRTKISCVHKAVSKWYLVQEERHLIEDPTTETQQDYETGEETDEDMESIGVEKPCGLYPPSGSGLKDAVEYQMRIKRVPAALEGKQLDEFPSSLKPKEEQCYYCHTSLSGPYEITGSAMIIGVKKVKRGTRIRRVTPFFSENMC